MKSAFKYLFAALLASSLLSFTLGANDWDFLGSRTVNFRLDRDVVHVGAKEGMYSKLLLKVSNGSLNLHKIVVSYGNGSTEEIAVRHQFQRGAFSRSIDLKGRGRIVKKITFWYDTKNRSRDKATLQVYGRH